MNAMCGIWAIKEDYAPFVAELMCRSQGATADDIDAEGRSQANDEGAVAVIPIKGVLTQHGGYEGCGNTCEQIGEWVDAAAGDNGIKAIVLDVDSPGGSVFGVQETGEKIRQAREVKPVFAVANSMMASAAYWLGSQATKIVGTPGADIGSIGVIMVHADYSAFLEKEGLKFTYITSSKHKAEGNMTEPLSDDALAHMQMRVNDYHGTFVDAIAKGRKISKSLVGNEFGQGRMFGAAKAKDIGMIDKIGTLASTVNRLLPQSKRSTRMRMQTRMQELSFSSGHSLLKL